MGDTFRRAAEIESGTYRASPGPSAANRDGWRDEVSSVHLDEWDVYRRVPEVRASVDWLSNAMSRVTFFGAWKPESGSAEPQPIEDNYRLTRPVADMFGGPLEQAILASRWYMYQLVSGECVIAAVHPTMEERRRYAILDDWLWVIKSAKEAPQRPTQPVTITWETPRGNIQREFIPADLPEDVIYHHYRQVDPDVPSRVISATKTAMEAIETLLNVTDGINAASLSQIVTSKMVVMSADVTIPGYGSASTPDGQDEDSVLSGLNKLMAKTIRNRRSASSHAPIILRTSIPTTTAPVSSSIAPLDLSTDYEDKALDILDWMSRRIAVSFGVPSEVVNSIRDQNHWNALYTGLDGARIVIAPAAAEFSRLMTSLWYQWQLRESGVDIATIKRVCIWYDTSALVQDPDRSETLLELLRIDPTLVTKTEVRDAVGLPAKPDEDFLPPPASPPSNRPTSANVNGASRVPGFPQPQSRRVNIRALSLGA